MTADGVHDVVDDGGAESEAGGGDGSLRDPRVVRGVVLLHGVRRDLALLLARVGLAADDDDGTVGHGDGGFVAARGGHLGLLGPGGGAGGELVHGVGERGRLPGGGGVVVPADGVHLAAGRGAGDVAAGGGKLRRGRPRGGGSLRVENLDGVQNLDRVDGVVAGDDVDLAVDDARAGVGATFGELRSVRPRVVGDVVDERRLEHAGHGVRGEAADYVNLIADHRGGVAIAYLGHRSLGGVLIELGVVLVDGVDDGACAVGAVAALLAADDVDVGLVRDRLVVGEGHGEVLLGGPGTGTGVEGVRLAVALEGAGVADGEDGAGGVVGLDHELPDAGDGGGGHDEADEAEHEGESGADAGAFGVGLEFFDRQGVDGRLDVVEGGHGASHCCDLSSRVCVKCEVRVRVV